MASYDQWRIFEYENNIVPVITNRVNEGTNIILFN